MIAQVPGFEYQLLTVIRALVEVAGLFLLGQAALFILAGRGRDKNGVYKLFCLLTRPVISGIIFAFLLVAIFIIGFSTNFRAEALAILGSVVGVAAGFFFGTGKKND